MNSIVKRINQPLLSTPHFHFFLELLQEEFPRLLSDSAKGLYKQIFNIYFFKAVGVQEVSYIGFLYESIDQPFPHIHFHFFD